MIGLGLAPIGRDTERPCRTTAAMICRRASVVVGRAGQRPVLRSIVPRRRLIFISYHFHVNSALNCGVVAQRDNTFALAIGRDGLGGSILDGAVLS